MLATLKPSLRRIGATALIVTTTIIYGALDSALGKETKKQMSEAFLGEPAVTKMKELQGLRCERDELMSKFALELAQKNSDQMLSVRNRMLALNFTILLMCAYISACLVVPRKPAGHAT